MGAYQLESRFVKRALGILVGNKLTTSQQCTLAAKKANVRKAIAGKSSEVILHLYLVLVRLYLECSISLKGSLVPERSGLTRESPPEGHKDD